LPILGKFCRFLRISAGFSHTDSHTESSLIENSPEAECEAGTSRSAHSSGISSSVGKEPITIVFSVRSRSLAGARNYGSPYDLCLTRIIL
jgi:hypothetical protein